MGFFNYSNENVSDSTHLTVLGELTEENWLQLAEYTHNIEFKAGDELLKAGDADDGVYILVSGRVEVIKKGNFGSKRSVAEIEEGSIFGELAFFDQQPRSAGIKAITDGNMLHLTQTGFNQLAIWNPTLARIILFDLGRVLAYRFRKATENII